MHDHLKFENINTDDQMQVVLPIKKCQQLANQEHANDNPDEEVSEEEETIGKFADVQESKRTKTG